jgi:hypothetical protein
MRLCNVGSVFFMVSLIASCGQSKSKSSQSPQQNRAEHQAESVEEAAQQSPEAHGEPSNQETETGLSVTPSENSNPAEESTEESSAPAESTPTEESKSEKESTTAGELTCEQRWSKYVDLNPVGKFVEHKSLVEKNFGGRPTTSESATGQKIVASSDDAVETEVTSKIGAQVFTSKSVLTKIQFIEACQKPAEQSPQVETGTEDAVEVPAGKFDTRWVIVRSQVAGTSIETKTWFHDLENGDTLMIKSVAMMKMSIGEQKTETLLVSTNRGS